MRKLLLIIIALLFSPLLASAHGTNYLEFNPDRSDSLKDADVATPSQIFYAQNDFLGGFDVWVANPGPAGTATFELLNEQGSVISTKTVSIPTIAISSSGTKIHIDLNSQLAVLADNKYILRINSSMPELRLYYSYRVQLLSHNAPFSSEYIVGVGRLGSEEQPFSFKYALYETTESSAPIISNINWTVVSETQMKIDFNTNEAVDYRIEYGISDYSQSTNFINDYQFCTEGISICSMTIPVNSNSTYQYRLTVKDSWGNQSQSTGTFVSGESQVSTPTPTPTITPTPTATPTPAPTSSTTPTPPGTTLSTISNLRVVNITGNSADIAWTTNNAANSGIVVIREVDFSLIVTSVTDPTMELEHLLGTGEVLGVSTDYVVIVKSTNSAGETTASLSFTTLAQLPQPSVTPTPSTTPPVSASATPSPGVQASGSGSGAGNIQWSPPFDGEPSDGYRIDIFNKDGSLNKTIFVPAGSHNFQASELAEGEYSVIVYANNDGVFEKVDKPVPLKVAQDDTFLKRLLALWPYLLAGIGLLAGYVIWKLTKGKASQVPQTPVS